MSNEIAGADSAHSETQDAPPATTSIAQNEKTEVAKKKVVKLKKKVAERIRKLNADGCLIAPLRLAAVATPLSALSEEDALSVLDTLEVPAEEGGGEHVADPTAWIVSAARGAAEQAAMEEEQWSRWDEKETKRAGELLKFLPEPVLERIRSINRTVPLAEPVKISQVAGPLSAAGETKAMKILEELVTGADEIGEPSFWVLRKARYKAGAVMARVDIMNRGSAGLMDLISPMDVERVRVALSMIQKEDALALLQELQEKAHEVEDPTEWVEHAVEKRSGPRAKRLQKLNNSGILASPIDISRALDDLSKVSTSEAEGLIGKLERRGSKINHPPSWLAGTVKHILEKAAEAEEAKKLEEEKAKKRKANSANGSAKKPSKAPKIDATAKAAKIKELKASGAMLDAAPMTPPGDENSEANEEGVAPNASSAEPPMESSVDDKPQEIDPEEEAAAWRALREAFGDEEDVNQDKLPQCGSVAEEDEWGDIDADVQGDAKSKPMELATEDDACDDGECDDAEFDEGEELEGDDDGMQ